MSIQKSKNIFLKILILLIIPINIILCDPPNWDENGDGVIEPLELGEQAWINGRLTEFLCWDKSSSWQSCDLSGNIPESICDFASRFGLLKGIAEQPESIANWEEEVNSIHSVLSVATGGDPALAAVKYAEGWSRQAGVDAAFLPNAHNSGLEFRCMPRDFSSWLWLQIGHTLYDRKVGRCKQCASLFFKGGGKGRRRAQSRSTRQFCSLECKIIFNNLLSKNRRLINQK